MISKSALRKRLRVRSGRPPFGPTRMREILQRRIDRGRHWTGTGKTEMNNEADALEWLLRLIPPPGQPPEYMI